MTLPFSSEFLSKKSLWFFWVLMSLIVALDPPEGVDGVKWCINLINELDGVPKGFKVGLPLVVKEGVKGLREVASVMDTELVIADLKLADIGYVMSLITKAVANAGVNTVIAHAFIGTEGALSELTSICNELGIKLVLVAFMSHPGAVKVMKKVFSDLLDIVREINAWGVVLPATMPDVVKAGRKYLGPSFKILAPGVGAQGAAPGDALCAGADYEIVGRLITKAENPSKVALELIKKQEERVRACRGL